jgi:hypothetical protein
MKKQARVIATSVLLAASGLTAVSALAIEASSVVAETEANAIATCLDDEPNYWCYYSFYYSADSYWMGYYYSTSSQLNWYNANGYCNNPQTAAICSGLIEELYQTSVVLGYTSSSLAWAADMLGS